MCILYVCIDEKKGRTRGFSRQFFLYLHLELKITNKFIIIDYCLLHKPKQISCKPMLLTNPELVGVSSSSSLLEDARLNLQERKRNIKLVFQIKMPMTSDFPIIPI